MFDFSYETPAFFIDAASSSIGFAANWLLQSTICLLYTSDAADE